MIENWDQYKDLEYYPDRFCACGCNGRIRVYSHHKGSGIPNFIHGHNRRKEFQGLTDEEWDLYKSLEYYPDRTCSCGCRGGIRVCPGHKYSGIPKYIRGHNRSGKRNSEDHNRKIGRGKEKKVVVNCFWCGVSKEVPPYYAKTHQVFCSMECNRKWRSVELVGENSSNWKGGTSLLPYPFEFNSNLKERIKNRDKHSCQLCGRKEKLCVHHINYEKEDLFDLNLITLCTGCNGRVNGDRDFWEDYFTFRMFSYN